MNVTTRILALAAALLAGGAAQAAGYPDHPVKIVVPFAPAGPTDVMARLIAQKLSETLKQQFYVENHPGAGGNIGMTQVAKSAPDGYTILVASSSYVVNPSLYAKNPYDPFKDFAPVTLAAASPNILVVNADFPAKSVKELVELIKKEPGKYNYAMPGRRHRRCREENYVGERSPQPNGLRRYPTFRPWRKQALRARSPRPCRAYSYRPARQKRSSICSTARSPRQWRNRT
jgi:tripartite-type tricarboxylate transporter receptor subunit TctC